jgi:hypothetical protein
MCADGFKKLLLYWSEVQVETSLCHKVVNKENQYGLRQMVRQWSGTVLLNILFSLTLPTSCIKLIFPLRTAKLLGDCPSNRRLLKTSVVDSWHFGTYGSGSGYPYHWLTHPDPDPALFVRDPLNVFLFGGWEKKIVERVKN